MITNHTQLLNSLIEKYKLKSYLEIGVQNPANNFDKVKCSRKVGVDPEFISWGAGNMGLSIKLHQSTSDEFFVSNTEIFDLIFIDGLHHADQVKRDFENSLRCLSDNGFIVIHDVLPENEPGTKVPRETKQWWGDVYKWAMRIREYNGIEFITYNIDNGCMVVKRQPIVPGMVLSYLTFDWNLYKEHGHTLMNVTSAVEI